jgi:hypothetical protein
MQARGAYLDVSGEQLQTELEHDYKLLRSLT